MQTATLLIVWNEHSRGGSRIEKTQQPHNKVATSIGKTILFILMILIYTLQGTHHTRLYDFPFTVTLTEDDT